jgi:long-chain fatty acid transport protein
MRANRCVCAVSIFILLLACQAVFAITDEEITRNFQFSLVNPGARSTAMGGAFIGLADDATAAEANPAGLTILTKPEVSFEYRNIRFDETTLNSFSSTSSGQLQVTSTNDLKDLNRPSFLGVVFPSGQTTFAISRQEVVNVEATTNESLKLFVNVQNGPPQLVTISALANTDQRVVNWNFSSASKISDNFSVGASLRYCRLEWKANTVNAIVSPIVLRGFETSIDGKDSAFAYNVGVLMGGGKRFSFGAVYKRNPEFKVTEVETGPIAQKPGPVTNVVKIPDTLGAGIGIRPNDNITLSTDVVWIKYSDLTKGFQAGYNFFTDLLNNQTIQYKIDNEIEYHVGGEVVVFIKGAPLALRQGYYFRPSNSLIIKSIAVALDAESRQFLDTAFAKRKDEHHFTLGAGLVFGPHFQLDWAFDIANTTDSFVASTVVRF